MDEARKDVSDANLFENERTEKLHDQPKRFLARLT